MAAIDHSAYAPSAPLAGVTATIRRTASNLTRAIRTQFAYRQTLSSLSKLSPRQLADIGLDANNLNALAFDMAKRNAL